MIKESSKNFQVCRLKYISILHLALEEALQIEHLLYISWSTTQNVNLAMAESYDVVQYLLDRANIQEAAELMVGSQRVGFSHR